MRHRDTTLGSTKSTGTRIGYTRVSTVAQTLDQQNEALGAAGVSKVFSDGSTGVPRSGGGLRSANCPVSSRQPGGSLSLG